MCEKICQYFFIVLILFFIWVLVILYRPLIDLFHWSIKEYLVNLNTALTVLFTFLLVFIAWYQLHSLNQTNRSSFILQIENRYGSEEILRGRILLEEIRFKISPNDGNLNNKYLEVLNQMKHIQQKHHDDFILIQNF